MELTYLVNMITGGQYEITFKDYVALQGKLANDELSGTYVVRPGTPEEITITMRHIVSLSVESLESEEYDG